MTEWECECSVDVPYDPIIVEVDAENEEMAEFEAIMQILDEWIEVHCECRKVKRSD